MYGQIKYIDRLNPSSPVVEVFKTNVCNEQMAKLLLADLAQLLPNAKINFDLDDCDHILRIECVHLIISEVVEIVNDRGYHCEVLE